MPRNLSQNEQETLVKLGAKGPTANLDHVAMNKLFTLGLIELDSVRRIMLTKSGHKVCEELVRRGVKFVDESAPEIPIMRE